MAYLVMVGAHEIDGIFDFRAARQPHRVLHGRAEGHTERHGAVDFRHHADEFIDDGFALMHCAGKIVQRLYVEHDDAALDWKSAGTNDFARDFVYQNDLVARGVHFVQQSEPYARIVGNDALQGFDGFLIFFFNADDRFFRAHRFHDEMERRNDLICVFFQ